MSSQQNETQILPYILPFQAFMKIAATVLFNQWAFSFILEKCFANFLAQYSHVLGDVKYEFKNGEIFLDAFITMN